MICGCRVVYIASNYLAAYSDAAVTPGKYTYQYRERFELIN